MDEGTEKNYYDEATRSHSADAALKSTQSRLLMEAQEKGLAEAQLDLNEIKLEIYQWISGKKITIDTQGVVSWSEPQNNYLRILSDYGIQKVMELVHAHVNKNTLLSNYDVDQINVIMLRITTALNDFILMSYENFFYTPTFEECQTILKKEIEEQKKLRVFAHELIGEEHNEKTIKEQIIKEMAGEIEKRMYDIKQKEKNRRLKEYDLITVNIEDQILSTYNRAWKGEERGSLRRHTTFSDVRTSGMPQPQGKGGVFGWTKG
jgi:hypothetical protein